MGDILTVTEVAELLKMSPSQVYSMTRKRGKARMSRPIPVLNLNGNLRFRRSDLEKWLAELAEEAA